MIHHSAVVVLAVVLAAAIAGCGGKQKDAAATKTQPQQENTVTKKDELVPVLDSLERAYETACKGMGIANWNSYSKEGPADLDSAKAHFAKIFLDEKSAAMIDEWRDKSGSLADKLLSRRLELWHRLFIGGAVYADPDIAKMENDLQNKITNFKFSLAKKPITRAQVSNNLRQEKLQSQRHKLWSVTGQLSAATQTDLINLIKLRNAKAKKYHFDNYYSLALSLQAVDEQWLIKTLNFLEETTRPEFQDFMTSMKKKYRMKEMGPWDFDFALAKSASLPDKYFPSDSVFSIIHQFQRGIGFKVDSLPIKEVIKDIPYSGLSLAITIPTDSRFLVNPLAGKNFYSVAFHEYGHSLKAVHTKVDFPVLRGYEWIPGAQCSAYEEGIADMHGEFTEDPIWLSTYTQATEDDIQHYMEGRKFPALYRMRRLLKDFFIEYNLYKNPDQDAAALERAMFKKYLLVDIPETEQHQFAASIWYCSYPCYYQNYIVAGMIATQLQEAMTNRFGEKKFTDPKVSEWIIHQLYTTGETDEWTDRIKNATGKSLEPGAYLRKLGIDTAALSLKK